MNSLNSINNANPYNANPYYDEHASSLSSCSLEDLLISDEESLSPEPIVYDPAATGESSSSSLVPCKKENNAPLETEHPTASFLFASTTRQSDTKKIDKRQVHKKMNLKRREISRKASQLYREKKRQELAAYKELGQAVTLSHFRTRTIVQNLKPPYPLPSFARIDINSENPLSFLEQVPYILANITLDACALVEEKAQQQQIIQQQEEEIKKLKEQADPTPTLLPFSAWH